METINYAEALWYIFFYLSPFIGSLMGVVILIKLVNHFVNHG